LFHDGEIIQGRKIKEKGKQKISELRQHSEKNEDMKKFISWLGDTSNDEVHGVLKWVMQDCNDTSMELEDHAKYGMIVKDDSKYEVIDYWCMIIKKYLQKGMKCSLLNCHFDEKLIMVIKKQSMFEHPQPCRLNMQLGDMHYWLHGFSFDEEYPQGV
jgi:hypothetical protein